MNGRPLSRSDVWDLATFDTVKIVKRHVYTKPAYQPKQVKGRLVPLSKKQTHSIKWKHEGWLEKGLSTNQALYEVHESYSK